jgi:hypothetical protein
MPLKRPARPTMPAGCIGWAEDPSRAGQALLQSPSPCRCPQSKGLQATPGAAAQQDLQIPDDQIRRRFGSPQAARATERHALDALLTGRRYQPE